MKRRQNEVKENVNSLTAHTGEKKSIATIKKSRVIINSMGDNLCF